MGAPPIQYPKTDGVPVSHNDKNWREGRIVKDLSGDAALAAAGDEAAQKRLETQRLLALRQRVRESKGLE